MNDNEFYISVWKMVKNVLLGLIIAVASHGITENIAYYLIANRAIDVAEKAIQTAGDNTSPEAIKAITELVKEFKGKEKESSTQ